VAAALRQQPLTQGTTVSERTLTALMALSVDAMREALALLPQTLKEHGDNVKRKQEARANSLFQPTEPGGKFALPEAAYGDKDTFHGGIEILGPPSAHLEREMCREHTESADSNDSFTAWNSGENVTQAIKVAFLCSFARAPASNSYDRFKTIVPFPDD